MRRDSVATWAGAVIVLLLLALPIYAQLAAEPFALTFGSRVLVFALAASSLNLVLGYGGMVSFGHALYLGLGAYAAGLLAHHGVSSGWAQLAVAVLVCAAVGALTGLISLRTTGIAFIMITLAFAQMFYYLFVSLKQYGGDDGLSIAVRSDLASSRWHPPRPCITPLCCWCCSPCWPPTGLPRPALAWFCAAAGPMSGG